MSIGVPLRYISNINLISDDLLELSYFKGYKELIESKVTQHLELLINYNIDLLFKKGIKKDELTTIIPSNIEEYHKMNEITIGRLEKLNIKLGYRKYIRIINNKIKEIIAQEFIENNSQESEDTNKIVEKVMEKTCSKRKHLERDLDEFALSHETLHEYESNDQ